MWLPRVGEHVQTHSLFKCKEALQRCIYQYTSTISVNENNLHVAQGGGGGLLGCLPNELVGRRPEPAVPTSTPRELSAPLLQHLREWTPQLSPSDSPHRAPGGTQPPEELEGVRRIATNEHVANSTCHVTQTHIHSHVEVPPHLLSILHLL